MTQKERGCGFRKKGGLYAYFHMDFVQTCPNLPLPIPEVCPVCGEGIRQARGIRYIIPNKFLPKVKEKCADKICPVCNPSEEKSGLMWVGKQYYTASQFTKEAMEMGISKRIASKPDIPIGTMFYFVHPHAIRTGTAVFDEEDSPHRSKGTETHPGIFLAARLSAFHKIIDEELAKDEKLIKDLEEQGITAVIETKTTTYQPFIEPPKTKIHVFINDKTPQEVSESAPYRGTCPRCNRLYGYLGDNPRYCPDCKQYIKNRGKPRVKKNKRKTTKKVKNQ